jgi:hypothetical protein
MVTKVTEHCSRTCSRLGCTPVEVVEIPLALNVERVVTGTAYLHVPETSQAGVALGVSSEGTSLTF